VTDTQAMPLAELIAEVMDILAKQPGFTEVVIKRCEPLRYAVETGTSDAVFSTVNSMHIPH
jgi:uncharacterized oxidoreductase